FSAAYFIVSADGESMRHLWSLLPVSIPATVLCSFPLIATAAQRTHASRANDAPHPHPRDQASSPDPSRVPPPRRRSARAGCDGLADGVMPADTLPLPAPLPTPLGPHPTVRPLRLPGTSMISHRSPKNCPRRAVRPRCAAAGTVHGKGQAGTRLR